MIGAGSLLRGAVLLALVVLPACGKKGPPLPPLHIVPDAVTEVSARRLGNEVRIRFLLPTKNLNGPAPVNLDRIEIYAATVAPGAVTPPNRDLLSSKFVVGKIPAKQPAQEGKPQPPDDARPGPGDVATFVEELTEANMTPQFTTMPEPVAAPAQEAPAAATAAPAPPPVAMRLYVIRGIARNGRPGQPAARIQIPLVSPPSRPTAVKADFSADAFSLSWLPPVVEGADAKTPLFNVYGQDAAAPLNPAPLDSPAFVRAGIEFGKEECFVVRSVVRFGAVTVESAATEPVCATPKDIFPPADPTGLSAVAVEGSINLIWDANTDADLAGYLVLRGEAPGDTLQAITPAPITETTFRDTRVTPGVRYVYAIVAVDRAMPPNMSGQSRRVEETAR